jgi:hypothetical protein
LAAALSARKFAGLEKLFLAKRNYANYFVTLSGIFPSSHPDISSKV